MYFEVKLLPHFTSIDPDLRNDHTKVDVIWGKREHVICSFDKCVESQFAILAKDLFRKPFPRLHFYCTRKSIWKNVKGPNHLFHYKGINRCFQIQLMEVNTEEKIFIWVNVPMSKRSNSFVEMRFLFIMSTSKEVVVHDWDLSFIKIVFSPHFPLIMSSSTTFLGLAQSKDHFDAD